MLTSIEFKVNFLRPATADGGDVTATSRVIRAGRQIGTCEVTVAQDEQEVARGLFTYLFFEDQRGS
jgi:uncharacterized protein (TIGR00369 family)